jgi:voltage-gated potassium channel
MNMGNTVRSTRLLLTKRLLIIFGVYLCILFVSAGVFDLAEGQDFASSLWWAVVTATTVGYGDLSPTSATGRLVATILMHLTTLVLMPLLTAEIAAKLIVNNDAFTHDEQESIKFSLARLEDRLSQLDAREHD